MVKLQPFQIDDGYTTFIALTDAPNDYSGESNRAIAVLGTEDGLEFTTVSGGSLTDGYLPLPEKLADPSSTDDYGTLYAKGTLDGYVELHYMDNYGLITQLTNRGIVREYTNALWAYPENPHPMDDEFESATLDSAWTEPTIDSYDIDPYDKFMGDPRRALHTERDKSWYLMQPPGDSTSYSIYKQYTLPTNVFIWARIRFLQRRVLATGGDATVGLSVMSSTGGIPDGKSYVTMNVIQGSIGGYYSSMTTRVDEGTPDTRYVFNTWQLEQGYEYVGIHKIGPDYYGWAFNDAGESICVSSTNFSGATDIPDTVNISCRNDGYNDPGNGIMGADFVRFVESATFLPGMHR